MPATATGPVADPLVWRTVETERIGRRSVRDRAGAEITELRAFRSSAVEELTYRGR